MSTRMSVDMGKIDIIPNGASEEFAAVYTTHKTARPKLLFVGTLHPRKGILPVLRRFVEKKDLEVEFVVCGDGPLRAEVESLAASDVRIDYRGRVNHETLVSIHRETNIFVFPSLAEGCPNALLEAMASGHACITYDVDTVNTTIVDAGVKCTPNGVDEVMVAIERLVGDPALLCSRIAAAHARSQHFSWEYTAGRVNEVIGMMTRNVIAAQGVGIS